MSFRFEKKIGYRAVAYCVGGEHDDELLFIDPERQKPTIKDIDESIEECLEENDYLDLNKQEKRELAVAILEKKAPKKQILNRAYKYVKDKVDEKIGTRITFPESDKVKLVPMSWIPDKNGENQNARYLLAGPSGSGKSTAINRMLRVHVGLNPKAEIFVFSKHPSDPVLDKDIKKHMTRIPCDRTLLELENPYNINDFSGTQDCHNVVIFDDFLNLPDPSVRRIVKDIMNDALTTARHAFCDIFCVSHQLLGGMETKNLIANCNYVICFPHGNRSQLERFLKIYMCMTPDEISKVVTTDSRWSLISKNYPPYILDEQKAFFL